MNRFYNFKTKIIFFHKSLNLPMLILSLCVCETELDKYGSEAGKQQRENLIYFCHHLSLWKNLLTLS